MDASRHRTRVLVVRASTEGCDASRRLVCASFDPRTCSTTSRQVRPGHRRRRDTTTLSLVRRANARTRDFARAPTQRNDVYTYLKLFGRVEIFSVSPVFESSFPVSEKVPA